VPSACAGSGSIAGVAGSCIGDGGTGCSGVMTSGGGSGETSGLGVSLIIGSGLETGIVVTGGGETGWAVTEPVPPETAATTLKTVLGAWDCVSVLPGSCC